MNDHYRNEILRMGSIRKFALLMWLVLTCTPIPLLIGLEVYLAGLESDTYQQLSRNFEISFLLHQILLGYILLLAVSYLLYLYAFDSISKKGKTIWTVLIVTFNVFAMPIFWYKHVWKGTENEVE